MQICEMFHNLNDITTKAIPDPSKVARSSGMYYSLYFYYKITYPGVFPQNATMSKENY